MKRDWLQLLTNIGVLIGLVLLLYELNQSRDLARAQLVDGAYDAAVARNLALIGETPNTAIAKSVFRPEEIDEADAVVLAQYYTALLVSWMRNLLWDEEDELGVGYFGLGFRETIMSEAYFLNTETGRRWWALARTVTDPEIVAAVDAALESMSPRAQRAVLDAIVGEKFRTAASAN